jgi:diaminopimelate decarboxylase
MAGEGLGADVASSGELLIALRAGFSPHQIFVSGPYKSPEMLGQVSSLSEVTLSIDSVSELQQISSSNQAYRAVLRLRPDYASDAIVDTGSASRFGIPYSELSICHQYLESGAIDMVGFHIFCGSQMLNARAVIEHLRGAVKLSMRAADSLGLSPEVLNLGGGFGIPYGRNDGELELEPIAEELSILAERVFPTRVVIELGRYLVAQAGWYLTSVVGTQTNEGRLAVVVDGGTHHRSDMCRLGLRTKALPPVVLNEKRQSTVATDVLGCLCLPDDVLAEASALPPLEIGDVLAFANAGAYGLSASPVLFLSHPMPAEVIFEGMTMELLRPRQTADSLLMYQNLASLSDR